MEKKQKKQRQYSDVTPKILTVQILGVTSKQIKGIEKIKPYAVDTKAIRRGEANLALMMTLTTADHYDWFIGKFPAHNYFEFYGYRVYRRNVYHLYLKPFKQWLAQAS